MLQNFIFLTLCVVAIKGTGEFTVLSAPESLSFNGSDPLHSEDIGEVVNVYFGNPVSGQSQWPGLIIRNPFNLGKGVIVASLDGIKHSKVSAAGKTYTIQGNSVDQTLNDVGGQLKAINKTVCSLSYNSLEEEDKFSLENIIGDVKIPPVANTKYLNGHLHSDDATYLKTISNVNAIAENLVNMEKLCNFIYISISIDDVVRAHGENSEAVNEALELFSTAVQRLNSAAQKAYNNEALVLVVVNKADGDRRSKRDIAPKDSQNLYNLAEYYNQDYPVIFNIILWFMVVFGFALLAICYAIGSMDPGRDSIIYRMTSTRMKKDN